MSDVFDPESDGIDFWESLEGMLVQIGVDGCDQQITWWTAAARLGVILVVQYFPEDGELMLQAAHAPVVECFLPRLQQVVYRFVPTRFAASRLALGALQCEFPRQPGHF